MSLPVQFDSLKDRDADFYQTLNELKEMALDPRVIDAKTKYLLGLAVNACLERKDKVRCSLGQARAAGASDEEIQEVLRLTFFLKGIAAAQQIAEYL